MEKKLKEGSEASRKSTGSRPFGSCDVLRVGLFEVAGGGASEPLRQRHLRRESGAQRRIALPEDGVVRSLFLLLLLVLLLLDLLALMSLLQNVLSRATRRWSPTWTLWWHLFCWPNKFLLLWMVSKPNRENIEAFKT